MSEAFAALDLGTSRLRVGALLPGGKLEVLASRPNRLVRGSGGEVHCHFSRQWRSVVHLLAELGRWCRKNRIERMHLGLCGQVSSLLHWDASVAKPLRDSYPIWLDATCAPALPRLQRLWADGGAQRLIGTSMCAGTNWLAAKVMHAANADAVVQIADAVFHRLTGTLLSHPSAQISLVDHVSQRYSSGMLEALGLTSDNLPPIAAQGMAPMQSRLAAERGLPPTTVHVGLMDTVASLLGLAPRPGDGLLLAGTSEIVGAWTSETNPHAPQRLIRIQVDDGWVLYGSSSSGGATLDWLAHAVLRRNAASMARLRLAAADIPAGSDGVSCLPWPDGERAPLWDANLCARFDGLRGHHCDAHMWRSAIEGIAYARRLGAEALERPMPKRFLAAGGGTADPLANSIRASVLNRPIHVVPEAETALLGVVRHSAMAAQVADPIQANDAKTMVVEPNPLWVDAYQTGYARFKEMLCSTQ